MNIKKLRDMNLHAVADELEQLRAFKKEVESQEPVYFWKEIGESDWMECGKDWYRKCADSPEHDTKLLYTKPAPADKPARITEQDAREICAEYNNFRMGGHGMTPLGIINKWLRSEGRTLLNKLNADREQVPAVAVPDVATEEMLEEGVFSLKRGLAQFPDNLTQIVSNIWEDMYVVVMTSDRCPSHEGEQLAGLVEALEEAYGTLERAVSPTDETPEAAIQSAMFVIEAALADYRKRGDNDV